MLDTILPVSFPIQDAQFLLNGPVGCLEVMTTFTQPDAPIAVICHPHPLFAGTMHNKVVTTLTKAMTNLGLSTVRFNFRGVGKSEGIHDNGIGELEDLRAVLSWLQQVCPRNKIWLAGFSFGSFIAAKMAEQWPVGQLISIAPPVDKPYFDRLDRVACPWLVVQGDQDEIVSAEAVWQWAEASAVLLTLIKMVGVGHFFHGQLLELRAELEQALRSHPDLIENDSHLA